MQINRYDNRITIQQESNITNDYGEISNEWVDIFSLWASINPVVGKEYFAAETVHNEISHKITIRYKEGIKLNMRIKFKDRYFSIISIINYQEKNIELQLMCKELIK